MGARSAGGTAAARRILSTAEWTPSGVSKHVSKERSGARRGGQAASPTAKGFVFITLEDEDGLMNVIVRPDVCRRYYKVLRNCFLLIVEGTVQKQRGILNVLAQAAVGT